MQSALSISTEGTLVFFPVAHRARESDRLFPIGTLREAVACAWIANRQTNPRIDAKNSNRSFRNTVALLAEGQLAFVKLRYAQTFFPAIFVYKYKRHIKVISFITCVRVALTDFNHRVI